VIAKDWAFRTAQKKGRSLMDYDAFSCINLHMVGAGTGCFR
jgi:hypothetical protein